jgi:hypothetical protein
MPKFKVGDSLWYAKCRQESVSKICPICYGKMEVTLILGNGDQVILPCEGCGHSYSGPTGRISEYEFVVAPEPVTITKVEVELSNTGETATYFSSFYVYDEKDLFETKAEAATRAQEKKQEYDKEQETRAECLKQNVRKSFSWNARYHMQEAKRNRKSAEYHEAKAVLCKARSKGEEPCP